MSEQILGALSDTLGAFTDILVIVSLGLVAGAVRQLSHAVHLLASARMTDALTQSVITTEREQLHQHPPDTPTERRT